MAIIDRSLLAHEARRKFIAKKGNQYSVEYCLVWVQGKDGKVFGSCLPFSSLGYNAVVGGIHEGLLWWPQDLL